MVCGVGWLVVDVVVGDVTCSFGLDVGGYRVGLRGSSIAL